MFILLMKINAAKFLCIENSFHIVICIVMEIHNIRLNYTHKYIIIYVSSYK